jgi:hypothetical protein
MALAVETILKESSLHGLGVFAAHDIPKGTVVWRFDPKVDLTLTAEEIDQLPPPCRCQLLRYSYLCKVDNRYVLCADDSRFMNHSLTPNTGEDFTLDPRGLTVATRDIKAGEELTANYFDFDKEAKAKLSVLPQKP